MKRLFSFFVIFVLLSSFVLAEDNDRIGKDLEETRDSGNSLDAVQKDVEDVDSENVADDSEDERDDDSRNRERDQVREHVEEALQQREELFKQLREQRVENAKDIREQIQERKKELRQLYQEEKEQIREAKQKQNEVRLAVHALLASENFTGGIGKEVSEIARDFDNSLKDTEAAEEKIRERDRFTRFLFGGDFENADMIQERVQNREEKVKRLEEVLNTCEDCDADTKTLLMEQIQVLKQEQERLKTLAQEENQLNGLFGWLRR